jgi:hypothetical protein
VSVEELERLHDVAWRLAGGSLRVAGVVRLLLDEAAQDRDDPSDVRSVVCVAYASVQGVDGGDSGGDRLGEELVGGLEDALLPLRVFRLAAGVDGEV